MVNDYRICSSCHVGWGSYSSGGKVETCMDKPENCVFFEWVHCGQLTGPGRWIDEVPTIKITLVTTQLVPRVRRLPDFDTVYEPSFFNHIREACAIVRGAWKRTVNRS